MQLLGKRSVISRETGPLIANGVTLPKFAPVGVRLRVSVLDGTGRASGGGLEGSVCVTFNTAGSGGWPRGGGQL